MISYLVSALRIKDITDELDKIPGTTSGAIIAGQVVPESLQQLNRFIQIYRVTPITAEDVQHITYRVNCRQRTEAKADALAKKVYDVLNRTFGVSGSQPVFSRCNILQTIVEEENLFNTVVEVEIKDAKTD